MVGGGRSIHPQNQLFAGLRFVHQQRGALPLPVLKRKSKESLPQGPWKVSMTFVLDISGAIEGGQASGCSQRGLLYSALGEQESSPNNKVALVRRGGAFIPAPIAVCRQPWCGVGGTCSVSSACCPTRALRLN